MIRLPTILAAAAALAFTPALAQDPAAEYSASDIVQQLEKGPTRGVCFGTTEACAEGTVTGGDPVTEAPGFNLLITFNLGSDDLSAQAEANLREFAAALADPALQDKRFVIEGHTDARGSAEFNEALSLRRANAVVAYLQSLGIDGSRLQAIGYGERALYTPEDPNADINRRVEAALAE